MAISPLRAAVSQFTTFGDRALSMEFSEAETNACLTTDIGDQRSQGIIEASLKWEANA